MLTIIRNDKEFGPYNIDAIVQMVEDGKVLKTDKAYDTEDPECLTTIKELLQKNNRKVTVKSAGSIVQQISKIGHEVIFPKNIFDKEELKENKAFLAMLIIGLVPSAIGYFLNSGWLMFYCISLYFAVIWEMFFYHFFKTSQVSFKSAMTIFFLTQLFVFGLWDFTGLIGIINPFYWFKENGGLFSRLLFFIGGVGLSEEFVKALPLFILAARAKEPLIPRTMVFYGLVSGLAFGVFEGVQYQMQVNYSLSYGDSFFWNIARLTYLPFIHAVFCGIAGYYISFANLYPKYRRSLYLLSIGVPMTLHGLYDTFSEIRLIAIPLLIFSVAMLMTYLKQTSDLRDKLR